MPIPSDQLVTYLPWDVIMIIASVICAIACMQLAGGMDYLVHLAEKALRKNPKHITFAAPVVTYLMTMLAGTGHTAFSTLPVIAEVAKEQGIRPPVRSPSRSLPPRLPSPPPHLGGRGRFLRHAGAAWRRLPDPAGHLHPVQLHRLSVGGPSSPTCWAKPLDQDEVYLERKAKGLIKLRGTSQVEIKPLCQALRRHLRRLHRGRDGLCHRHLRQRRPHQQPADPRDGAIMGIMLSAATLMVLFCKLDAAQITNMPTFKSGMSACICVLGVAWLGNVFVKGNMVEIQAFAGDLLSQYSWLLAVVLFFSSMLLYSQGATTKA